MKKSLVITFIGLTIIGLFNVTNKCISTSYSNNKVFTCKGILNCLKYWFYGKGTIQDSGTLKTKELPIKGIKKINASGVGNLIIQQCEDPQNCIEMLKISADDNILPLLKQVISGDQLTLEIEDNVSFSTKTPINYYVTVKDINSISTSGSMYIQSPSISTANNLTIKSHGSGDIKIKNIIARQLEINQSGSATMKAHIHTDKLHIDTHGSGEITLSGNTNDQTIRQSGSGTYNAKELNSKTASFKQSGSGSILLTVIEKITGTRSGAGSVTCNSQYNPETDIKNSGSGSVKKANW